MIDPATQKLTVFPAFKVVKLEAVRATQVALYALTFKHLAEGPGVGVDVVVVFGGVPFVQPVVLIVQ